MRLSTDHVREVGKGTARTGNFKPKCITTRAVGIGHFGTTSLTLRKKEITKKKEEKKKLL